mgnify:CR=1 FL=1|tara:strand:- start:32 stop:424 length:393 start_codon:yes stop_codon:yes gene_type:complete
MADARTSALKHVWWIERDAIAIAKNSATDTTTNYVSVSEVKQVNVHAVKKDEDFVASGTGIILSESPSIPAEFHEALANYAIAKGYELKPELIKMAGYFRSLFNDDVREGKRYANKGRDGTAYNIIPQDY